MEAYLFSPEGQEVLAGIEDLERDLEVGELPVPPCVCHFPTAHRSTFVQLVSRWGRLKTLCTFGLTVEGTPFNDSPLQHGNCPQCRRPLATEAVS